jgi:hypothetical protein
MNAGFIVEYEINLLGKEHRPERQSDDILHYTTMTHYNIELYKKLKQINKCF